MSILSLLESLNRSLETVSRVCEEKVPRQGTCSVLSRDLLANRACGLEIHSHSARNFSLLQFLQLHLSEKINQTGHTHTVW